MLLITASLQFTLDCPRSRSSVRPCSEKIGRLSTLLSCLPYLLRKIGWVGGSYTLIDMPYSHPFCNPLNIHDLKLSIHRYPALESEVTSPRLSDPNLSTVPLLSTSALSACRTPITLLPAEPEPPCRHPASSALYAILCEESRRNSTYSPLAHLVQETTTKTTKITKYPIHYIITQLAEIKQVYRTHK
jgi:hypothetical protein